MINKTEKHQYFFEVDLNWLKGREGIITANDVKDSIYIATPPEFSGGIPDKWSPEHLFLGSLCSCFMTTFLAFAEKEGIAPSHFKCSAIGRIQLVEGHLEFTGIDLYPKIYLPDMKNQSTFSEILIKTHRHSIIAQSIRAPIIYHEEILLEKHREVQ